MKKIFVIIIAVFSLGIITAKADNDRVITKEGLPIKAQQFINTHFATIKVSYIKEDRDFFDHNYEIVFADGSKIEFGRSGEAYVKKQFPDAQIVEIERKRGNHEVKLSNKLELIFDKKLRIKGVGD